jgi:type 1 glutamine amidotransferase
MHRLSITPFIVLLSAMAATAPAAPAPKAAAPAIPGQNPGGMHIYLRAGLKTHGEGLHDYPQFLADWSKLLTTQYGAVVDGSLHAPKAPELEHVDVVVMYKGDAGYMTKDEQADLEGFVRRGGGLVFFHDTLCGPDPGYVAALVGGAKLHGETNFTLEADVPYTIAAPDHPIMQGVAPFTIRDEAFFLITWATSPRIQPLLTTVIAATRTARMHAGEVVPQMWVYEHTLPRGKPARAFVWMQGHFYKNFTDARIEPILVRGIAWAGHRPVNELLDYAAAHPPPVRGK